MDKLWDDLHRMELTSVKPWKDLTEEVRKIKEDASSHVDIQAWEDSMEESISPILTNLLGIIDGNYQVITLFFCVNGNLPLR